MRVLLVGDSTVTDDAGWGLGFRARMSAGAERLNHAMSGRSSKRYRDEGLWETAMATEADYVLIQFGHNDQPGKGPERETDPDSGFAANLARYVTEARAATTLPILVTSLTRRQFDATGGLRDTLGPYVAATRRVATDLEVPLVDLHAASTRLCETLGRTGCEQLSPREPDGSVDTTHLNAEGGLRFGGLVADLTRDVVPELKPFLTEFSPAVRG
ncbi:rhamnogalacturonan acetylesterase [Micromonospora sp. CPCC 205371]|nr:rhamnogalacturonan acetylesterase [Micromonospora sp. CPCC 205371]